MFSTHLPGAGQASQQRTPDAEPHASNITRVLQRFTPFQSPDGGVFLLPKPFFTLTEDGGIGLNNVPVPNERIEEGNPRSSTHRINRALA